MFFYDTRDNDPYTTTFPDDLEEDIIDELVRLGARDKIKGPCIWFKHEGNYASKFFLSYDLKDGPMNNPRNQMIWRDPIITLAKLKKMPNNVGVNVVWTAISEN